MESLHEKNPLQKTGGEATSADAASWLTEDVMQALLTIPTTGIIGVNAALLFSTQQDLCAYWWRERNGEHHSTFVSPQTVKAALMTIPIDSGYLPPDTLRIGITGNGSNWMLVSLPPRSYHITIEQDETSQIPLEVYLPGAVFFGLSDSFWIWAVKDTHVTENTQLYHFPLPNIGADGTMCYGENHPPKVTWPQILPAFYLFLDSPFSSHWSTMKSLHHPGDIRAYLCTLTKQSPAVFPDEELVALQYGRSPGTPVTLHGLVQTILERKDSR